LLHDPGHRFELDVVFHGAGAVTSPTHELARAGDDEARRVQLAAGAVVPDRDCVLVWRPVQATTRPTLSVFTTHDEAHTYFLALVAPPAATTTTLAREVIVLLDHSGSMTGPKWQAADWAVERLLLDLTADDVFDLCLFHTSTTWFAPAPQPAEDGARVDEAVAWLKSRRDSGGTNLGVALEEALRLPRIEAATPARNVLIVTDAAVTDGGRILRLADQEADREDRRRISVLCIDAAPNAFLANELAARGGGQAVFLTSRPDAEDITTALEAVLTTWAAPVRTDLRLVVPGGEIEGADGGRRGDDAAALDVGDLPARQVRWVVGRVPRGEETLHMQLHDGTGVVAEAGADALTEAMAAIKPLFGVRRVNALEFLSSARYEDAALREQLQRLGYDPATVLPTGREQSVYAETAAKETAAALHDLLRDEALRYGLLTSVT
ncbi:MAG: VWA domain-containing protein, partial [Caldilineaceae bacterium]|nr:VWA domain-containing protein [Caldilineaceae bacterium]